MRINKLSPWLPQGTPSPLNLQPNLDKKIQQAKLRATRATKERIVANKKYHALLKKRRGPFSQEMIEATASFLRTRRESSKTNHELRRLLGTVKRKTQ